MEKVIPELNFLVFMHKIHSKSDNLWYVEFSTMDAPAELRKINYQRCFDVLQRKCLCSVFSINESILN
jgi:hypothetical protein